MISENTLKLPSSQAPRLSFLNFLKILFSFTVLNNVPNRKFFTIKWIWSLSLSLICFTGYFFIFISHTQTIDSLDFFLKFWLAVTVLHVLTVPVSATLFILNHFKNHFSKLPLVLGCLIGCAASLYFFINDQNLQTVFFLEITSLALLAQSTLFYFDQKSDTQNEFSLLQTYAPKKVRKQVDNHFKTINIDNISVGDIILIAPNEFIPCDGKIVSGITSVDESFITKEFKPIYRSKGKKVYRGTLNRDNPIKIRVTSDCKQDVFSFIRDRSDNITNKGFGVKNKIQKLSNLLTLFTILGAFASFLFLNFTQNTSLENNITLSLSILFSCAFGLDFVIRYLSTKLTNTFLKKGILISKNNVLDRIASLQHLFFQRTGILTQGELFYTQEWIQDGCSLGEFLSTLISLEYNVDNLFSKAIATHPWYNEIQKLDVVSRNFHPGLGISGKLKSPDGKIFKAFVGNLRFMKRNQCHISRELKLKIDEIESIGETVILCGYNRQVKGFMAFTDTLKKEVKPSLKMIRKLGIKLSLLTGDSEKTVTQALGQLDFDSVYSRCTPEEKIKQIKKQKAKHKIVGLVSNDTKSEAFQNADITFSLDSGTKILKHPSDVIVMGSDIKKVSSVIAMLKNYKNSLNNVFVGSLAMTLGISTLSALGYLLPHYALLISSVWSFALIKSLKQT